MTKTKESPRLWEGDVETIEEMVEDGKYDSKSHAIRELVRHGLDNKHPNY